MSDTTHILRAFDEAAPTRVRDYVDLLKPRVMSLVGFTGLVGDKCIHASLGIGSHRFHGTAAVDDQGDVREVGFHEGPPFLNS